MALHRKTTGPAKTSHAASVARVMKAPTLISGAGGVRPDQVVGGAHLGSRHQSGHGIKRRKKS